MNVDNKGSGGRVPRYFFIFMPGLPKSLGVCSPGSGPLNSAGVPWAAAAALWASLVAALKPKNRKLGLQWPNTPST